MYIPIHTHETLCEKLLLKNLDISQEHVQVLCFFLVCFCFTLFFYAYHCSAMTTMQVLDLGQADLAGCQMPFAQKVDHFPAALKRI